MSIWSKSLNAVPKWFNEKEQNMNFKQEEEDYNKLLNEEKNEARDGAILALFTSEELTEEIMRRLHASTIK